MPQLRIDADDFNLHSDSTCQAGWTKKVDGTYYQFGTIRYEPTIDSKTVVFELSLPARAKIKSAKVHSTWGSCLFGYAMKKVDGLSPDTDGFVEVTPPAETDASLSVSFQFQSMPHSSPSSHVDDITPGTYHDPYFAHTSAASVTDVYLLIEYEDIGGYIYHAENGVLVPYNFYRAEGGVLVPYYMFGAPCDYELVTQNLLTADGENLRTADDEQFKVLGGE